ncbi:IclR family transcriptional regulator (plasmid) [Burkholderia sp. SFA1]|uniref:IclR family transcriptional regulator domain-containing protein n=1 Tax=unclassified Caballeronia TaxID=2646786 RepID=UPI001F3A0C95|nr:MULTISPECIES: IclR family transcriptional regulator C-terminal domain-containing protein [unclassified Caballeronia]MCE4546249.1 helix-turn-helix domain-containing protein [Caballeronia sp. PC1]MCE4573276.1 helix-turn-helix domain-containing protein [Caballeronia sp. CLC5]BBQ01533.1 IclR family transcriptional regulator [Burkholderia sp. SFA1]
MTSVKLPVNAEDGASASTADIEAATEEASEPRAREGMGGLAKGLAIIEAFSTTTVRMTVAEAARLADVTRPAARRCLLTLVDLGYLSHDGKFFTPLPRMLRLGGAYLSTSSLAQIAQPLLAAARDELQESVSLAVLDEGHSVFVGRAEAVRIVSTGAKLGGRFPAYCSATGRVLLSQKSEGEIVRHISAVPLRKLTARTIHAPDEVIAAIHRVQTDGYAISDEELELGMRAMAVPVKNRQGGIEAAVSVSVSSARVSVDAMKRDFLPVLQRLASRLERAL